mgnify:CR=1 FL=1
MQAGRGCGGLGSGLGERGVEGVEALAKAGTVAVLLPGAFYAIHETQRPPVDALRSAAAKSEDVGERFAEEARRIHYGDSEERAIRGKADRAEMIELIEEGIPVLPVPPDKDDLH